MSIETEIARIKTNISNAYSKAEEKGATLPELQNSENLVSTIDSIDTGKWQPQPDWWDIDSILENDTEDYPAKMIILFSDSQLVSRLNMTGASKIKTSDGSIYTSNTSHTWDVSKDKECSLGYKTRYIIFYYNSTIQNNLSFPEINLLNPLYIIHKNMNFSIYDGNALYYECYSLECIKMINCTRTDIKIRYNGSNFSLRRIIGFDAPNVTNIDSLFNGCHNLCENDMQEILSKIDWDKITIASSAFREFCPLYYFPNIDTSKIQNFNYMFDNSSNLKVIESLDFSSATAGINSMFLARSLISINNISNIKLNGMNFKNSPLLNHNTLIRILEALYDYSSDTENTYTLTLGATNLAKLTEEEIAIGTNKGWTIS